MANFIQFPTLSVLDVSCIIETWRTDLTSYAELLDCTPPDFTLVRSPLPKLTESSLASGGGTTCLIRDICIIFFSFSYFQIF